MAFLEALVYVLVVEVAFAEKRAKAAPSDRVALVGSNESGCAPGIHVPKAEDSLDDGPTSMAVDSSHSMRVANADLQSSCIAAFVHETASETGPRPEKGHTWSGGIEVRRVVAAA